MKHLFIVNPRAGKEKENISVRVREFIAAHPEMGALVFNTEYVGHETVLVGRLCHIFEDETIRLYICGGSGTLCRAISGIPNFAMVEVAFFPCGMTNDILKVFEGEAEPFSNLANLVTGTPMYLDVLDFGFGKALNFCSVGYEARVSDDVNALGRVSIGGTKLPYLMSIIKNTVYFVNAQYNVVADGQEYTGRKTSITAFNGIVYGGSFSPVPNACPVNGRFKLMMTDMPSTLSILFNLKNMRTGQLDKLGKSVRVMDASEVSIKMPEKKKMFFSADGETFEMEEHNKSVSLRVLPTTLKFVVPSGVALKEQCREGE
jgi:diacylglycerol kinase family enzyme